MNPKSINYEIKGNMRQYKPQEESKEIQQFSNMNKYNLPNSKRTLIPSYQPINNQENMNHVAFSYYSNKFNTNSVGPDFIPNEEPQIYNQRQSAAQILQESSQPKNIRQLKPNIFHKKYVETSQINNIPGPEIMKRFGIDNKRIEDKKYNNYTSRYQYPKNNINRKNSCYIRNKDIESFQRKVFRDHNSNIACLPGANINEKEKRRTLVAINSRKNESHISFGNDDDNKNNNNKKNRYDYDTNYYKQSKIQRPYSCSGKRIIRDKNKESNILNQYFYDKNTDRISNIRDYYTNDNRKQKYIVNKNKSQIVFG